MRSRWILPATASLALLALSLACGRGGADREAPARQPAARKTAPPIEPAPAPKQVPDTERSAALTASARLLAGLPVETSGPWAAIQERAAWKAHARVLGTLWKQHESARLSKVRQWAEGHLGSLDAKNATVFYPFGGPDALYPTALFPDSPTFVLVGLEPVGAVPDLPALEPSALDGSLKAMELYITPILQISFFRTNDMEVELADKGTVPILMTFLAGTGHRILDVQPLSIDSAGAFQPLSGGARAQAARIDFAREGASAPQSLYYISEDLSEAGLKGATGFRAFLGKMGRHVTFLKAASYLMHRNSFATIRGAILDASVAVLQDDSGIPLKFFSADRWTLSFFGTYTGPIKLFASFSQKDLLEAYHGSGSVEPLGFGIGYRHHAGESNLMLAVRRARD